MLTYRSASFAVSFLALAAFPVTAAPREQPVTESTQTRPAGDPTVERSTVMDDVSRLQACEEIKLLKARYTRGIDTKDWGLVSDVLADDVVADFEGSATDPGTGVNFAPDATGEVIKGRENFVAIEKKSLDGIVTAHQVYAPEIELLSETTARAVWGMHDELRFPDGAPIRLFAGFGHYHETYERVDGKWKIKTLRLTRLRVDVTKP
ncbi:nuclear transport factor 2 family protein [Sphingopyxis sp.]|uniref:nuclear transport factor 2 family protein n=1 Tax=Sphingopyxis sp. TaxID=1908224 RepID=UPI002D77C32D|nr:nuclear transport factor 2 family protein [Sphingopyxis sp.]HET6523119.1 nuclear transport factor 2 family protein [Sphingopyxis sp.]